MAESWCKVASDLDNHPKIRKARNLGRQVFEFALRRNARSNNPTPGFLPSMLLEPWFVADQLMLSEDDATKGIELAIAADLLARDGDGVRIVDWSDEWGKTAKSNAERQSNWRSRQRRETNEVTPVTETVTNSVTHNNAPVTPLPRSEKIREDQDQNSRSPSAHAIPQYDPDDARQRGKLAETMWSGVSADRVAVAAELALDAIPFRAITPGSHPRGFTELQDRIREEGKDAPAICTRIREALVAQARTTKSIEWLSEKSFTDGGWRTAREAVPGWRQVPRATQKRSAFEVLDEAAEAMTREAST